MNHIYNRIYNNRNSLIHYISSNSSFDLLIEKIMGDQIIQFNSYQSNFFTVKNIILNDHELLIHDNNLLNSCLQNGISKPTLFLHKDISTMKKEDILLIKERLKNINVINLEQNNSKIFDKTLSISIPKIKKKEVDQQDKICFINTTNNSIFSELTDSLNRSYKTDSLVDFMLYENYDNLLDYLSSYRLVIFSNYIDGIVASSVGCQVLSTRDLIKNKQIIWDSTQKLTPNYDFASFSKQIMKAIEI